jgi:tetratricopeptide (TPR) repeat protein
MLQRELGDVTWQLGDTATAELHLAGVQAGWATHEQPDTDELIAALTTLFEIRGQTAQPVDAQSVGQSLLDLQTEHLGPDDASVIETARRLAHVMIAQGKHSSAEQLYRQVYESRRRVMGPVDPDTMSACRDLTDLLAQQGKQDEAARWRRLLRAQDHWAVQRGLTKPDDPRVVDAAEALAACWIELNQWEQAEPLLRDVLALRRQEGGPSDARAVEAAHRLVLLLEQSGQATEAAQLLRTTAEGYRTLADSADASRAALLRQASEAARRLLGGDDPVTAQLEQSVLEAQAANARSNGT